MWILILLFLLTIFIYVTYLLKRQSIPKGTKLIPTEFGYPVIGIYFNIKGNFYHYLWKLSSKHGQMFRIMLGSRTALILNNYESMRKCLKDEGDAFSGRWQSKFFNQAFKYSGILFTDGDKWAKQRSFVLRVLRDFGLGKSQSFDMVQEECGYLVDKLTKLNGRTELDFVENISFHTVNIISKFIMDKRYNIDDQNIHYLKNVIEMVVSNRSVTQFILMLFPFLDKSDNIAKLLLKCTSWGKLMDNLHGVIIREIDDHKRCLDLNSDGNDLIDKFLIEQNKMKQKLGNEEYFSDFQLVREAFELFLAGYETTSTTLTWSMFFLSRHPAVQHKLFEEINKVIGIERVPDINIKKKMPYTEAVMDEIMRLSSVVPLAIFHRTMKNVEIDGSLIEKDVFVIPNIYACHRDESVWEKPLEFYPEHFLIKNNDETDILYNPRKEMVAFGMGKRQCLGEALARIEYFLFLVTLIQKFEVKLANPISDEMYEKILSANDGNIRKCNMNNFIFTMR